MDKPERIEVEPRAKGPQTMPRMEDAEEIVVGVRAALEELVKMRSVITQTPGYEIHARIVGTQWRGEIMISVTSRRPSGVGG